MTISSQLFLFDEPIESPPLTGIAAMDLANKPDFEIENFLVQEIIEAGKWNDLAYLIDARDELRHDVRESSASPDDFLVHETRSALKLVASRIQELQ